MRTLNDDVEDVVAPQLAVTEAIAVSNAIFFMTIPSLRIWDIF
jgi:hypothetical protein